MGKFLAGRLASILPTLFFVSLLIFGLQQLLPGDPALVMACHCADCQVLSGAPLRAVVTVPIETLVLTGQPKSYVKVAQSGNPRAQVFCPECGTPLFSRAAEHASSVTIRLGCVTQRDQLPPVVQIWQRSAMPWLAHLGDISGSPEQQAVLPIQ
mgnify:CR=1 FL=1